MIKEAPLIFRPATAADLDGIAAIILHARDFLARQGLDQWQGAYPAREDLAQDIAAGHAWVLAAPDGAVLATMALTSGCEPDYDAIDGAWGNDGPYATIHRLAVAQNAHGGAAALRMLAEAQALARQGGLSALRADTHSGNRPMRRILERAGYARRGSVTLHSGYGGAIRLAYDLVL